MSWKAVVHTDDLDVEAIPDRRLELMLVCAHPAIERAAHTPLMLNTVLGFTAEQVGRAFSVPPASLEKRLVRAKKRIKAARIPFRIPDRGDLPARMTAVLEAVYGAYVIDWSTTGPQATQLPSEALHLAEVLTTCAPGDPEAHGLAALVQLSASRVAARLDGDGRFVPPPSPPRSRAPRPASPRSTPSSTMPTRTHAAFSPPGPLAHTCSTSSGAARKPYPLTTARSI